MRCVACDKILTEYELTKKYDRSGEFVDMCNDCSRFLSEDYVAVFGNVDYANLYDLEEGTYVEDGTLDYGAGTEQGDEGEWL